MCFYVTFILVKRLACSIEEEGSYDESTPKALADVLRWKHRNRSRGSNSMDYEKNLRTFGSFEEKKSLWKIFHFELFARFR